MNTPNPAVRVVLRALAVALAALASSAAHAQTAPWEYLQTLQRGEEDAEFGYAMSASGGWLAIGLPYGDVLTSQPFPILREDAGGVMLFRRQPDGSYLAHGTLPLRQQPQPEAGARYGHSVSLSGNRLMVGAPTAGDTGQGRVEFWAYDVGSDTWEFEVGYPGTHATGGFGFAVALSGDLAAAGEPGFENPGPVVNSGRVQTFVRNAADTFYIPDQSIEPLSPVSNGSFGLALALFDFVPLLSGMADRLLIGEPNAGAGATGLAWIYERGAGGFAFAQLVPPPPQFGGTDFGSALDLSGAFNAIGGRDASRVAVVRRNTDGSWTALAPLQAPSPTAFPARFGEAIDFNGSRLLIGHPQSGASADIARAHLFTLAQGRDGLDYATPIFQPGGATGVWNGFGTTVALDGLSGSIGAPKDPIDDATQAGRVAVYFTGRLLRDGFEEVE